MTADDTPFDEFRAFEKSGWDAAALAYHDHWGGRSSQSADALLDAAHVGPGTRLLDVATGAGYVAAKGAARGAVATGLDFSPSQLALAQETFPGVQFVEGSAEALPYESGTFDAVTMGFGMNHLPHPEIALAEAYRVLAPGGWLAFTVWGAPHPGQAFGIVLGAIERFGTPDPGLPPAPPYFRYAERPAVAEAMARAGFIEVETSVVPQFWRHDTPDQVFDAFHNGAVRATAVLRAQAPKALDQIRAAVREEVSALKTGDQYLVPVPAALSSGRKPG